jgi:hypothetical protein
MSPKGVIDMPQECLTPPESATIIASLFAVDVREKRLARRVVRLQMAFTLIATVIVYGLSGSLPFAVAVLSGGLISVLNGALLAWRMSRAALHSVHEAHPSGAHHQLRLMYYYAAERFLAVAVLLGLCLVALKLSPLAVLGGFVAGQAVLLAARLFLNK